MTSGAVGGRVKWERATPYISELIFVTEGSTGLQQVLVPAARCRHSHWTRDASMSEQYNNNN